MLGVSFGDKDFEEVFKEERMVYGGCWVGLGDCMVIV